MKALEDTHWYIFMFMDDWKYGEVPQLNDEANKLYEDLAPYDKLECNEKNKDEDLLDYSNNKVNFEKKGNKKC